MRKSKAVHFAVRLGTLFNWTPCSNKYFKYHWQKMKRHLKTVRKNVLAQ